MRLPLEEQISILQSDRIWRDNVTDALDFLAWAWNEELQRRALLIDGKISSGESDG